MSTGTSGRCAPIASGGIAAFARARRRRRPARASGAKEAASMLTPIQLFVRKRFRPCGGGFSQTLVAERLAECCILRCGQLFPDGWMHYVHQNARGTLCTVVCSDESSKSEITFAGPAGLTTGISRQHSLANAKLDE